MKTSTPSAGRLTARRDPAGEPFVGGWFLYLGYELAAEIEPTLRLPASHLPQALAWRMRSLSSDERRATSTSLNRFSSGVSRPHWSPVERHWPWWRLLDRWRLLAGRSERQMDAGAGNRPGTDEPLVLAFSPCPNDTFVFNAWVHGLLPGAAEKTFTLQKQKVPGNHCQNSRHDFGVAAGQGKYFSAGQSTASLDPPGWLPEGKAPLFYASARQCAICRGSASA